jgi:hypothetical protein
MKSTQLSILVLLILEFLPSNCFSQRIEGSPYPFSQTPTELFVLGENFNVSEILTIETLQGVLAQSNPQIYRIIGSGYQMWIQDLIDNYGIIANYSFSSDFQGLLNHFKNQISGYVICNTNDNSVNVAISLCGMHQTVAITEEKVNLMAQLNIPMFKDIRGLDESWFYSNYNSLFNKNILCYQKEKKFTNLADYSVFSEAITFYDPISSVLTNNVFSEMNANSVLFGWGDSEFTFVRNSSSYSIMVHPADWANNLSTLTNFSTETVQHSHIENIEVLDNVHTVCFVMTDGDNIQWLLNDFATSDNWFGSPNRSNVKLGWTISPALSELAPTVLKYLYGIADTSDLGKDYFIAGPSGLGYIFPEEYDSLYTYVELMNQYMKKADLKIVNVIGNSSSEQYIGPYLEQDNVDALFYYEYSHYSGLAGKIDWINDKPVIGGRYNLWDGFESPSSLAAKLNTLSKDIHSEDGYSLIPVHVWSNNVDSVISCVRKLNADVRVVTPDEFVKLILQNLRSPQKVNDQSEILPSENRLYQNYPNPFNASTKISYLIPNSGFITLKVYDMLGREIRTLFSAFQEAGAYSINFDANELSSDIYFCRLQGSDFVKIKKMLLIK